MLRAELGLAGLAFLMPPGPLAATPWGVLLASAGSGLLTRVVLRPVTSWSGASFSSVMPLGYEGGVWWLRARMASGMDGAGLSLDTITGVCNSTSSRPTAPEVSGRWPA